MGRPLWFVAPGVFRPIAPDLHWLAVSNDRSFSVVNCTSGSCSSSGRRCADLRVAVVTWVEQGLTYTGKGGAPRDAIAGAVGLGKTTVTLEVLAQMAQGVTVHYYARPWNWQRRSSPRPRH